MPFVSFYIDGAEGTGRAEVLARAAADAALGVDGRELERVGIVGIRRHHGDGLRGAMAGAVVTCHLIPVHDAVLFDPYGVAYLDG